MKIPGGKGKERKGKERGEAFFPRLAWKNNASQHQSISAFHGIMYYNRIVIIIIMIRSFFFMAWLGWAGLASMPRRQGKGNGAVGISSTLLNDTGVDKYC